MARGLTKTPPSFEEVRKFVRELYGKRVKIKEVPGMPGYYATTEGDIISARNRKPLLRKKNVWGGSHETDRVNVLFFYSKTGSSTKRVGRLILRTFVGEPPQGYVAHHINGIFTDDRLSNLEWKRHSPNLKRDNSETEN